MVQRDEGALAAPVWAADEQALPLAQDQRELINQHVSARTPHAHVTKGNFIALARAPLVHVAYIGPTYPDC
jgi:hypothetical protein